MLCCWPKSPFKEPEPLIVDLNEVLSEKAWNNFRSKFCLCQKMMFKKEHFVFEVPENYFDFKVLRQEQMKNLSIEVPTGQSSQSGSQQAIDRLMTNRRNQCNPENVTLDTEFSNDTAEQQKYNFRFEKTRRTEIEVTFQRGFTFGGKANFSVKIPLTDTGVEAEMQYQVTKSEGQRFEESMLMEATSEITVGPNSRYTANVQMEEKALHTHFRIITRMSMPQGRAPVYIKRKSDGRKVHTYNVNNLIDIFKDAVPCSQIVKEGDNNVYDKIDFVIEGIIKGLIACNHKIMLTSDESEDKKKQAKIRYMNAIAEKALGRDNDDDR